MRLLAAFFVFSFLEYAPRALAILYYVDLNPRLDQ